MRGWLSIIFILGIITGFIFFSQPVGTGQAIAIECTYENQPCTCTDVCICGEYTIPREECYSNNNR